MKTWLLSLWLDEAKFTAMARGLVFGAAQAVRDGLLPGGGSARVYWLTYAVQAASLMVAAGQKNK